MKNEQKRNEKKLILACQAVLQTVGGTNAAATAQAHAKALEDLREALAQFKRAA
ncbi:hypothetical protein [Ralstonia phage GP4]|uniref:Uncharacterized protein n=1 Tax=Ralstonia phage GP4 TaxID=2282904 RepID=A0A345GTV6_9CAUD|nr:hypothetical protein KMC52_gp25 [Ralstonia phage GP4]AXG67720.1 hypothetical protein [Ralstonia phage GP4]